MENKQKNILVVEDEKPLIEVIKIKLEQNDFNVITARSVEQAKNYIMDGVNIDVVWLDHYLLGKESGLDFVVWCKGDDEDLKKLPIFVVSNTATQDKVQTYLQLGVNDYYVKAEKRLDEIVSEIDDFLKTQNS